MAGLIDGLTGVHAMVYLIDHDPDDIFVAGVDESLEEYEPGSYLLRLGRDARWWCRATEAWLEEEYGADALDDDDRYLTEDQLRRWVAAVEAEECNIVSRHGLRIAISADLAVLLGCDRMQWA